MVPTWMIEELERRRRERERQRDERPALRIEVPCQTESEPAAPPERRPGSTVIVIEL